MINLVRLMLDPELPPFVAPRAAFDEADAIKREKLIAESRRIAETIEQDDRDVRYWNETHPNEEPIQRWVKGLEWALEFRAFEAKEREAHHA